MTEHYFLDEEFVEFIALRAKIYGDENLSSEEINTSCSRYDELLSIESGRRKVSDRLLIEKSRKGKIVLSRDEAFRLGENDDGLACSISNS
jgi:hypothetical protein